MISLCDESEAPPSTGLFIWKKWPSGAAAFCMSVAASRQERLRSDGGETNAFQTCSVDAVNLSVWRGSSRFWLEGCSCEDSPDTVDLESSTVESVCTAATWSA